MKLLIALLATAGTLLQAYLSALDLGRAKKRAVEWWNTEDELAAEHPRLRRLGVRRQLRAMRDDDVRADLRLVQVSLTSWTILLVAAFMTVLAEADEVWF